MGPPLGARFLFPNEFQENLYLKKLWQGVKGFWQGVGEFFGDIYNHVRYVRTRKEARSYEDSELLIELGRQIKEIGQQLHDRQKDLPFHWDRLDQAVHILQKVEHSVDALNQSTDTNFRRLPSVVLNTLQGSANTTAGKLGELVRLLQLQATYDRIIPVGDIVDFIAIKLPKGNDPGAVHFVEIKTGKRAVLNPDQRKLKESLEAHPEIVKFVLVKTEIESNESPS